MKVLENHNYKLSKEEVEFYNLKFSIKVYGVWNVVLIITET